MFFRQNTYEITVRMFHHFVGWPRNEPLAKFDKKGLNDLAEILVALAIEA